MPDYVASALFVYSGDGKLFLDEMANNPYDSSVFPVSVEELRENPAGLLKDVSRVVVSADLFIIKEVMMLAMEYGFSLGFLPLVRQRALSRFYGIPKSRSEMISLALQTDPGDMDLVFCNDHILLFKGIIGRVPLIDGRADESKLRVVWDGLRNIRTLQLLPFTINTLGDDKTTILTAASGCAILENAERRVFSGMEENDCSFQDGMISTVIVAPFSVVDYFRLMWIRVFLSSESGRMPDSVGHIKTSEISIESDRELMVSIDGEDVTVTPAHFRVQPNAVKISHGADKNDKIPGTLQQKEKLVVQSLPEGKEIQKTRNKRVPFFTYASEDRFKDLFTALRSDGQMNSTYVVLMVLSTVLATVGLYLNSVSVIIGAMLLAPLMAPIISLAMSLLRYDRKLFKRSLWKVFAGILLALTTALVLTVVSPYQPLTSEMQGRLNPTVLDLIVAIVAGVAGAYTKSYKEILQSLAGVAIAVALVPPLAVAGIGLGRFDLLFFSQAFLLFTTNLIGIILAATFTFRVLGFSPVVRDKRSMLIVVLFFIAICIPLSVAFDSITDQAAFEKSWQQERFLVNGKYLIVNEAKLREFRDHKLLVVDIYAREPLDRSDLNEFKRKVQRNFSEDIIIRAKIIYIP